MKRSRFTEEQIIGVLWEQEAGVVTAPGGGHVNCICDTRRETLSGFGWHGHGAQHCGLRDYLSISLNHLGVTWAAT